MRFDVEELFKTASMMLHQNLDIRTFSRVGGWPV